MKSVMSLVLSSSEAELAKAQCVVVLIQILNRFLKWFILTSIVTTSLYYNKLGEDIHFSGFSYRIWSVLHWFSTSSPYCCLIFIVVDGIAIGDALCLCFFKLITTFFWGKKLITNWLVKLIQLDLIYKIHCIVYNRGLNYLTIIIPFNTFTIICFLNLLLNFIFSNYILFRYIMHISLHICV